MKKINKKKLDKVLAMTREYWKSGDTTILGERIDLAKELEKETGVDWLAIIDLTDGILNGYGFCPDACNYKIYSVLSMLGWCLYEDEESEGM